MIWTTGSRYEVALLHTAASTLQSQQPPGHQHGVPAVVTEAEEEDVVAVSCVTTGCPVKLSAPVLYL